MGMVVVPVRMMFHRESIGTSEDDCTVAVRQLYLNTG